MKYGELLEEYRQLLHTDVQLRRQTQSIPKGYITTKRISGKDYYYLQYSVQGKKKSEYIREEDLTSIRNVIAQREPLRVQMEENRKEQIRLESAARILDIGLYRIFLFLKQCADMDAMPVAKRQEALLFASAMTALEGLPSKVETENGLQQWARGEQNFADIYMKALIDYRVVEGM